MSHQGLEECNTLPTYNTNHKQGATKLLKLLDKYLIMVIFDKGKNYLTQNFK